MGYVLSILMNALRTWLLTKLWDSFFTRRFNGKQFWAYWLLWTAIITVVLNVLPNDYDYSNIIRSYNIFVGSLTASSRVAIQLVA